MPKDFSKLKAFIKNYEASRSSPCYCKDIANLAELVVELLKDDGQQPTISGKTPEAYVAAYCRNYSREYQNGVLDGITAGLAEQFNEVGRLKRALSNQQNDICQILGKALGYPKYKDDPKNFPGHTNDDVCVGEHTAETLAAEAVKKLQEQPTLRFDVLERNQGIDSFKTFDVSAGPFKGSRFIVRIMHTEDRITYSIMHGNHEYRGEVCGKTNHAATLRKEPVNATPENTASPHPPRSTD